MLCISRVSNKTMQRQTLLEQSVRYFQALDIQDEVFEHLSIREIEADYVL